MRRVFSSIMLFVVIALLSSCSWFDKPESFTKLVVGSDEISGNFMMGFGTDKASLWAQDLMHGYHTYATTPHGEVVLNETVVESLSTSVDEITKNKTYTFVIYDDLFWSDGKQITADDFIFSVLFSASIDWEKKGARTTLGDHLIGYDAYRENETSAGITFAGVRGIDERTFSLTIDGAYLPFFYDTLFVNVYPLPMHVLSPESTTIITNENGSSMNSDAFDMIDDHLSIGGFRYMPTVTAGPYRFESFSNQIITLNKDPLFKGDYRGHKPAIDMVVIKAIDFMDSVILVKDDEIDLLTENLGWAEYESAETIDEVHGGCYTRNGYSFIAPVTHFGPTMDYRVRQAIAYLTDQDKFIDEVWEGYAIPIYADYVIGQWLVQSNLSWIDEHLNTYAYSIDEAHAVLDQTEWIYESDGVTLFNKALTNEEGSYLRYNAHGDVLSIHQFRTESGAVYRDYFQYQERMSMGGIAYEISTGNFDTILEHYYYAYELKETDKAYHLFTLSTNYDEVFDPYQTWHSDHLGTWKNAAQFEDSRTNPQAPLKTGELTLDELMVEMRETDPDDKDTYLALWKAYQMRWNYILPAIPISSHHYFYIYDAQLEGVTLTPFWDWTSTVIDMRFTS